LVHRIIAYKFGKKKCSQNFSKKFKKFENIIRHPNLIVRIENDIILFVSLLTYNYIK